MMEICRVITIPSSTFQAVMQTSTQLAIGIAHSLARQMAIATFHERALAFHSIEERLAAKIQPNGADPTGNNRTSRHSSLERS